MHTSPLSLEQPIRPIQTWANLRTELIWIYDGPVHPRNRQRQTDHTFGYWVWLLRAGSVQVIHEGRSLKANAGECMVSPHGLLEQRFSKEAEILSIHFTCGWPSGEELFAEKKGAVFKVAKFANFQIKAQCLSELVHQLIPPATDIHFGQQSVGYSAFLSLGRAFSEWLDVFASTLLALGFTHSQIEQVDSRLYQAVRCLNEVSISLPFPAELMQSESGLGRSQLERLFLQSFGMTTRSYWNRRKIQSAHALLTTTGISIKEISFRLGFSQAANFTKWFQLQSGLSPRAFRLRETIKRS